MPDSKLDSSSEQKERCVPEEVLHELTACLERMSQRPSSLSEDGPAVQHNDARSVRQLAARSPTDADGSKGHNHRIRSSAPPNLPQELWDETTSFLLPSSALNAADIFKFTSCAYDRVWSAVFAREDWLTSDGAEGANIVLIGVNLDILSNNEETTVPPRLVMAVFDRQGDVQYERDLLSSCLRGDLLDSDEHQSDRLILVKSRLDVPELMGNDFSYLFSDGDQGIQTKYCYWGDPEKKIRNLHAQNIRGIGGAITRMENLKPIFLLNLNPPTQFAPNDPESPSLRRRSSSVPVQFIFRCFGGSSFWTGCPPLVDVMVAEGEESGPWERTFEGFTYKDERYNTYHRNDTDWVRVAELESRQRCNEIETS